MDELRTRFAAWVSHHDAHAAHRLSLLSRADQLLKGDSKSPQPERGELADALERWRYQHLNERHPNLTPSDWELLDALDLTANRLAGRDDRPPRNPRAEIHQPQGCQSEIDAALACLHPDVSLAEVERRAGELTEQIFRAPAADGSWRRRLLMYAPLYLSSHCVNHCLYCGFRFPLAIERKHLTVDEALAQAAILTSRGFRHVLLVAGDFPSLTTTHYFTAILSALTAQGIVPAVEIAPQSTASYAQLVAAGAVGVTLYQETYDVGRYAQYHPRGSKTSYDWRLEGLDRAAEAGMRRLGMGVLLGLADPRADLAALVRHGRYLKSRFPLVTLAFSLPRIRQAPAGFQAPYAIDDETFIRMYCGLRCAFPGAELVLSTREAPALRNRLAQLCITQISAGSSTTPGGYHTCEDHLPGDGQFPVIDQRTPDEVAHWLQAAGLEPVWDLTRR